jgi:hypothetical protein
MEILHAKTPMEATETQVAAGAKLEEVAHG